MKLTTQLHLVLRLKNEWSYTSTLPLRLHGVVFSYEKHRDNFTFYLCQPRTNLIKDENGNLFADSHSILNRCQLLNVTGVKNVR